MARAAVTLLLTFLAVSASADESGFHCNLLFTEEIKQLGDSGQCDAIKTLFPTTDVQRYWLIGHGEGSSVFFGSESSTNWLALQADDSEAAAKVASGASTPGATFDYLENPVGGKWVFMSETGDVIASANPSPTMDGLSVPPEDGTWDICGQKVKMVMPCLVGEQPTHSEAGFEEAPCTYLGDCDEGLVCVELNMFQRQCVTPSRLPEGAKVVSGPQPAGPYDNCFFAPEDNKCAVQGFTCYKNSQWENYAQCRPTGDCPRTPSASAAQYLRRQNPLGEQTPAGSGTVYNAVGAAEDAAKIEDALKGRRLAGAASDKAVGYKHRPLYMKGMSIQSVTRKLSELESFHHWQRSEKRRRLAKEGRRLGGGPEDTPNERRRRLQECVRVAVENADKADSNLGSLPSSFGSSAHTMPGVRVTSHGRVEVECEGEWLDFSEVSTGMRAEYFGTIEDSNDLDDDALALVAESETEEDGSIDIGWTYGWDCDAPMGNGDNGLDRVEARQVLDNEGVDPYYAVPENDEEMQAAQVQSLQLLDGWAAPSGMGGSSSVAAAPVAPPAEPARRPGFPGRSTKCSPDIPTYSGAPGRNYGFTHACAPTIGLSPGSTQGVKIFLTPTAGLAPDFHPGVTIYVGNFITLSPAWMSGFRYFSAPILRMSGTWTSGVSIQFAPVVTLTPFATFGTATSFAPFLHLPNIFEDWLFRRTPLPPSKVKRFTDLPKSHIPAKTNTTEIIDVVNFVRQDLTPLQETEAAIEGVDLPTFPGPVEKFGIKKNQRVGDYILIGTGMGINCPRYDLRYDRPNDEHVKVLFFIPRDTPPNVGSKCLVPYPSDVIRDIPHLPPQAIHAIRVMESIENTIPPPIKIGANMALSFTQLVATGQTPDFGAWLKSFGGEYHTGGLADILDNLQKSTNIFDNLLADELDDSKKSRRRMMATNKTEGADKGGMAPFSLLTPLKAMKLAEMFTPEDKFAGMPKMFPEGSPTVMKAHKMADALFRDMHSVFFGSPYSNKTEVAYKNGTDYEKNSLFKGMPLMNPHGLKGFGEGLSIGDAFKLEKAAEELDFRGLFDEMSKGY
uniref:Uncharacterized protein n=1 Tax=Chromera velia CCMP2878 TaxID=1169474 RepID=A0A0G4HW92_9ALVE|mmetsp:Transcript_12244/g.23717  ORF Transcript_12244/g.23717 Transcript_12244/m.23717 type:complete len:1067 (-) Transcript_12244:1224-4424(-)|eukprot:Cvel_1432.t1-p1 / transcript=Cvel_1432.t1 / gene=Cvel_1432 / organism=Chromera_velia_CCMP2878 / gene_product=hypothetical protein / transcript_product=hypothetical protein / location=Cvel_scaffold50:52414-56773(-) / protein_length=1066 / sequence_SO=supercontig / SO=protein_coding / is_pseudo=false